MHFGSFLAKGQETVKGRHPLMLLPLDMQLEGHSQDICLLSFPAASLSNNHLKRDVQSF